MPFKVVRKVVQSASGVWLPLWSMHLIWWHQLIIPTLAHCLHKGKRLEREKVVQPAREREKSKCAFLKSTSSCWHHAVWHFVWLLSTLAFCLLQFTFHISYFISHFTALWFVLTHTLWHSLLALTITAPVWPLGKINSTFWILHFTFTSPFWETPMPTRIYNCPPYHATWDSGHSHTKVAFHLF